MDYRGSICRTKCKRTTPDYLWARRPGVSDFGRTAHRTEVNREHLGAGGSADVSNPRLTGQLLTSCLIGSGLSQRRHHCLIFFIVLWFYFRTKLSGGCCDGAQLVRAPPERGPKTDKRGSKQARGGVPHHYLAVTKGSHPCTRSKGDTRSVTPGSNPFCETSVLCSVLRYSFDKLTTIKNVA